jgi:glycosylphosphatidylinositol phospholipase D
VSKWNEETQKLFIFLLGIQSHSITDIVWHSIGGVNDGFIRENAKIAFKGDFQRSHDNADVGGDLVLNQQLDNDFIVNQWFVKIFLKALQVYSIEGFG